jgi:hypothetical protein
MLDHSKMLPSAQRFGDAYGLGSSPRIDIHDPISVFALSFASPTALDLHSILDLQLGFIVDSSTHHPGVE